MKKILIVIGAILLAGLIGAGGFWGGMKFQWGYHCQPDNDPGCQFPWCNQPEHYGNGTLK